MGTNTLTDLVSGTIDVDDINDIHEALSEDFVPRNASGVATNEAGSLGTPSIQWAAVRGRRLFQDGQDIASSVQLDLYKRNQVISSRKGTNGNPTYLDPAGAAGGRAVTIFADNTDPLKVDINGTEYTFTASIVISGMTAAPSSNNTTLLNDTAMADQAETRTYGEYLAEQEFLTVDAMGSEISTLAGTVQGFKLNNGSADEYLLAYINSTTQLTRCMRGAFFDSSLAPIVRIVATDNDVITIMKTAWIFLKSDGTASVTYNNPTWSASQPASASTDDRWYDLSVEKWKKYNGSTWDEVDELWIGIALNDTADCIAVRERELSAAYKRDSHLVLELATVATAAAKYPLAFASVAGKVQKYEFSKVTWSMATDLAGAGFIYSTTEQASRRYFFYITATGALKISDVEPYYRADLFGFYHPHAPWRAVGCGFNNSGSDLDYVTWFAPEFDTAETDFYMDFSTTTQGLTTGAGFENIVFGGTANQQGIAITMTSTTVIRFRKRGFYEVSFRADFQANSGTVTFTPRLRNTTDSVSVIDTWNQSIASTNDKSVTWTGNCEIRKLGKSYSLQVDTASNSSDLVRCELIIRRLPGLFIGAESI